MKGLGSHVLELGASYNAEQRLLDIPSSTKPVTGRKQVYMPALFKVLSASLALGLKGLSLVGLKLLTSIVRLPLMDMFCENTLDFE